jgi:uncharacterized protein YuzE
MKISYDPEIDALYIRLLEGRQECRSVRLSDEVALNIGTGEELVGIEILDATSVIGIGKTPAVTLEGIEPAGARSLFRIRLPRNTKRKVFPNRACAIRTRASNSKAGTQSLRRFG